MHLRTLLLQLGGTWRVGEAIPPSTLFSRAIEGEPSSGLDPITARRLDDLIIELRDSLNTTIVIVLEIDEDRLTAEGVAGIDFDERKEVDRLVALGLRAALETESVVTGVGFVALDVKPATPAYLVGDRNYPEIPSLRGVREETPDKLNQVLTNLANTDFPGLVDSVNTAVGGADRLLARAETLVGSPDLARAVASLDELTAALRNSVSDVS